ncbi:sigma-70 family RNA polymerase sigma factor [Methylocystis iwaonis]|uniref:RNA polymerase sigma factor n=1 Tax=Methylocystis iwaonis TaxID=2885079 RepID=A0ABN6VBH2_9HYPH|nr:sigma-70 family RNA polymerase sigma factor [Methylocystis iwaonis]BDV32536.1 RNA polymerase sigma factor [Methylocystis iwaonis]
MDTGLESVRLTTPKLYSEGDNRMPTERYDRANTAREARWRTLMSAAQEGDNTAYATLLTEMLPLLRRSVAYKRPGASDVEDIVQEILISIHTVRHTYDPGRPFMPWLMTIVARRAIDALRRQSARSAHETTVDVLPETFSGDDAKSEQEVSDDQEFLRRALSQLPDGQREAIELMKIRGLSLQEASVATGRSVASLKVSVHRAIKTMRDYLKKESSKR